MTNKHKNSIEHILSGDMEDIISSMLYYEIKSILLREYGLNGKYSSKELRELIPNESHTRDRLRNWLKKDNPEWIYKKRNKKDFKKYGKLWSLRKELDSLRYTPNYETLLKEWENYNIHHVFKNCVYIVNDVKTYKSDRDNDIINFIEMNKEGM